jgi:hypothetical protein
MEVHQGPRPPRDQPEWFTGDLWIDAIAQTHGHSRLSTGSVPSSARVPGRAALTSGVLYGAADRACGVDATQAVMARSRVEQGCCPFVQHWGGEVPNQHGTYRSRAPTGARTRLEYLSSKGSA